jgi:hypothetical protein
VGSIGHGLDPVGTSKIGRRFIPGADPQQLKAIMGFNHRYAL